MLIGGLLVVLFLVGGGFYFFYLKPLTQPRFLVGGYIIYDVELRTGTLVSSGQIKLEIIKVEGDIITVYESLTGNEIKYIFGALEGQKTFNVKSDSISPVVLGDSFVPDGTDTIITKIGVRDVDILRENNIDTVAYFDKQTNILLRLEHQQITNTLEPIDKWEISDTNLDLLKNR